MAGLDYHGATWWNYVPDLAISFFYFAVPDNARALEDRKGAIRMIFLSCALPQDAGKYVLYYCIILQNNIVYNVEE